MARKIEFTRGGDGRILLSRKDASLHHGSDAGETLIWITGAVIVGLSMSIAVAGWF